jgi:methylase of polypeptide subunit release factors
MSKNSKDKLKKDEEIYDKDNEKNLEEIINIDKELLNFEKCDIFTPDKVSKQMIKYLYDYGNLLEPSVGDGQLLKYLDLEKYNNIDIYDIKKKYLDICPTNKNINKNLCDFIKEEINTKYKNIILNPPYIRIQDLSKEYRDYIKEKWSILDKGNIDYYYVFILKCLDLLDDDGIMVSITPNSYLYNKSSEKLRKFLIDKKLIKEIIDYKSEKVFKNVSTYCCITIFSKENKEEFIYNGQKIKYDTISKKNYNIFSQNNEPCCDISKTPNNIGVLSENKKILGEICNIKNGIATLRDKIYVHENKKYDEPCWKIVTNSVKDMWLIYPYDDYGNIINEEDFKINNPKTYEFLNKNREELNNRDKGKKKYATWYAYGRTQSLIKPKSKKVIYVSCFVDPKNISYHIDNSKLFISCLCIEPKNKDTKLNDVIKI